METLQLTINSTSLRTVFLSTIDYFSASISGIGAINHTIDPSVVLRMPVRAGPNGADHVIGDKGRRITEIFLEFGGHFK